MRYQATMWTSWHDVAFTNPKREGMLEVFKWIFQEVVLQSGLQVHDAEPFTRVDSKYPLDTARPAPATATSLLIANLASQHTSRMGGAQVAAEFAVCSIPVLGDLLSGLLREWIVKIDDAKDVEAQCGQLQVKLPPVLKWLMDFPKPSDVIRRIQDNLIEMNNFVQDREKLSSWLKFIRPSERKRLDDAREKLQTFKTDLKELLDFYTALDTNQAVQWTLSGVTSIEAKLDDVFTNVKLVLERQNEQGAFQDLWGSDPSLFQDELNQASNVESVDPVKQQQAQLRLIGLSVNLVRDGTEKAQDIGLTVLLKLAEDTKSQLLVLRNTSVVQHLLEFGVETQERARRTLISRILESLGKADTKQFFEQLAAVVWQNDDHCVITDARLTRLIVKNSTQDLNAFHVLVTLSKTKDCKSVIAEAGGIAALAAIYQNQVQMSWRGVSPLARMSVDALASLSTNEDCREKFASGYDMWPLLHFIWSCSTISVWFLVEDWSGVVTCNDNEGNEVGELKLLRKIASKRELVEPDGFIRHTVRNSELHAGEALWTLSTQHERCRHRMFRLGTLYQVFDNEKHTLDDVLRHLEDENKPVRRSTPFDALHGWLEMANKAKEAQCNERAVIQSAFEQNCEGSNVSYPTTDHFVPIVWSVLLHETAKVAVAEWHFGALLGKYVSNKDRTDTQETTKEKKEKSARSSFKMKPTFYYRNGDLHKAYDTWGCVLPSVGCGDVVEEPKCATWGYDEYYDVQTTELRDCRTQQGADLENEWDQLSKLDDFAFSKGSPSERKSLDLAFELIKTISTHLGIKASKRFDLCLNNVVKLTRNGEGDVKAKAFSVLWLCVRFLAVEPRESETVIASCRKTIAAHDEHDDNVFWATNLVLSMLSWQSFQHKQEDFHLRLLDLAISGVGHLLKTDGQRKYIFLAKYLLIKSSDTDLLCRPECIPFLCSAFQIISDQGGAADEGPFFDSVYFERLESANEEMMRGCLKQLVQLWPQHKELIAAQGASILSAMLEQANVESHMKTEIEEMLKNNAA